MVRYSDHCKLYNLRWLKIYIIGALKRYSVKEHILLLQWNWIQFFAPIWQLININNSSSVRSAILFWPPGVPGTHVYIHNFRQNTYEKEKKKKGLYNSFSKVKVSATKLDNWSSIPGTHLLEFNRISIHMPYYDLCVHCSIHLYTHS